MTLCDLINRLKSFMDDKRSLFAVDRTAQVKLGKYVGNEKDVYDYFDIIRVNNTLVLVPSDKWDKHALKKNGA